MVCCLCNKTGSCRKCKCAKNGRKCSECQPSKLGRCQNTSVSEDKSPNPSVSTTPPSIQANSSRASISDSTSHQSANSNEAGVVAGQKPTNTAGSVGENQQYAINDYPSTQPGLPDYHPISESTFSWGSYDARAFTESLNKVYYEVVHWRPNAFLVPYGKVGSAFVSELARLFGAFSAASALESVALKAATVLPILLLQKPSRTSKSKEHISCLQRRLVTWLEGDLQELLSEGRAIQSRLRNANPSRKHDDAIARTFAKLMSRGKTKAALRPIAKKITGTPLRLDDVIDTGASGKKQVQDVMISKHPPSAPVHPEAISNSEPKPFHPVIFDALDASCIRSAALRTEGAAGPSGIDALGWRRLCTSYNSASNQLCQSLAATARRLCTCYVDPKSISALTACRLMALNKNPGVRPIGIGETVRRILAKAILSITKGDVQEAVGTIQLCAGQLAGIEAGVHATRVLFEDECSEAALLVDATNAFNSLNRKTALQNVQRICPSIATTLINTYREPAELFMDGNILLSREGTTQGDPLAMPMYAIAMVPLIKALESKVHQTWYADDATGVGKLSNVHTWWDEISVIGPRHGYYANAAKTWLVTTEEHYSAARITFAGTDVNITKEGRPHLGAPLGSTDYKKLFLEVKVKGWCKEIETLMSIAHSQPQAAFTAFTHGFTSKWSFLSRDVPDIHLHMQPLEDAIQSMLLPALTGRPPFNALERELVALPARLGGLGLFNPVYQSSLEFRASLKVTRSFTEAIVNRNRELLIMTSLLVRSLPKGKFQP